MIDMQSLSYLLLILFFSVPVILYIVINYRDLLVMYKKSILACVGLSVFLFFIVDTSATYFYAWQYDYAKTLNIIIHERSVLEDLIWTLPVSFVLAVAAALAHHRHKNSLKNKYS